MKRPKPELEIIAWIPSLPLVFVKGQSGRNYKVNYATYTCGCYNHQMGGNPGCKHLKFVISLLPFREALEVEQIKRFEATNTEDLTVNPTPISI
jgi:hypothetical protein